MKRGSLFFTRHGAAQQERFDPTTVQGLPYDQFKQQILDMNMRQGLTEQGTQQGAWLGRYIGNALVPNATSITAVVGPYKRHQETFKCAVTELAGIRVSKTDSLRLAERNRGELDASIWPVSKLMTERPDEAARKAAHPATWKPAKGEDYSDVNTRVKEALTDIDSKKNPEEPVVVFSSGELSLATLALSGLGHMEDKDFLAGITIADGRHIPLITFENAAVVGYHDPNEAGQYTHYDVHSPIWTLRDQPFVEPEVVYSGLLPIR